MTEKLLFKPCDTVIILLAAFVCFTAFSIYMKPQPSTQILIQGTGGEWIFPLEAEETVRVPGPLGDTIIRIHNNEAWVESSPCVNQVCVAAGHINRFGAWVACLPNNVFLIVEGNNENGAQPDAVSW
jgi:hypothetical protein